MRRRSFRPQAAATVRRLILSAALCLVGACAPMPTPALLPSAAADLIVLTWNSHGGHGNLRQLVDDLETGQLTGSAPRDYALLLQEFVNHRIGPGTRTTVLSVLSLGARAAYAAINVGLFWLQAARGIAAALLVAGAAGALATVLAMWARPRGLLRGKGPVA